VLRHLLGLTTGLIVKWPFRLNSRSKGCIGQHKYLRLLELTVFALGTYWGYILVVKYCSSLYLRHSATIYHQKFWLLMPSKCSSTTVSRSQTKGHHIVPQSPDGSIILIASFFQGASEPYVTKRWSDDLESGIGHLSEQECTQRISKWNQMPTASNSSSLIEYIIIDKYTTIYCDLACFNRILRCILGGHYKVVVASGPPTQWGDQKNFGSIQPFQMALAQPIYTKECISDWLEAKSGCDGITLPPTRKDVTRPQAPPRWWNFL